MTRAGSITFDDLISRRATALDVSGIRRVFELGAKLKDPINLSIGQPDFPVPDPIKQATIEAIQADRNGYTLTQGDPALREVIRSRLADDVGWDFTTGESDVLVTGGTSGGLFLAFLALLDPGDEVIIADPYFVIYPAFGTMTGATVRRCDTYPDFRMTAERIEPLITAQTKIVLVNSPGNPSGVVLTGHELREITDLCDRRGLLLISDEIYDEFTFADAREEGVCPSPARFSDRMLLIRGFGKTYGCTGWRMGYLAGPTSIISQIAKIQQYTFVCAPSMAQAGLLGAFAVDMRPTVDEYAMRRDMVVDALGDITTVERPGGAFYVFVEVPPRLGISATEFVERAIARSVLTIPGGVFSDRDTHFRISYAIDPPRLKRGLEVLRELLASD